MKEDSTLGGMNRWLKKPVKKTRDLPLASDFNALKLTGPGKLTVDPRRTISGKGSVVIETPTSLGTKNPTNRSYASAEVIRPLKGENLTEYNRFSVWVYADAPGFYNVFVGCTLYNQGTHVMPVPGRFEGQHFVTVYPNRWQRIVWEIPDLYRDSVTGFSVNIMLTGSPKGASQRMKLFVDDMRLETVDVENTRGFNLRKDAIAYSHSGYRSDATKQALVQNVKSTDFEVLNASTKKSAFKGKGRALDNGFVQLDFSTLKTPGYYTLSIDGRKTQSFAIGNDAFLATAWHTLNFFYSERCGYDQPGIHQECHKDVTLVHPDGRRVSISGGWHDAADLTQGLGNTARGGLAMLELSDVVAKSQPGLHDRLLAEARWGLNWVLETRFGDGYRSGGLIIGIWSDNITGTKDDMEGKATNRPSDNFFSAAYCAAGAPHFAQTDPVFSLWCRNAAIEDFRFASEMLGTAVSERNEAESHALATVSAMHLYRLTHDKQYLDYAAAYARVVMDCQQTEKRADWSVPLRGFFYESRSHKRILEYFHQSNEHLLIQGLTMLLKDSPGHPDAARWKAACEAYADYLMTVSTQIHPYGILPAAVYELNNAEFAGIYHEGDRVGMPSMEEYNAQVKNGIKLSDKFYLRRFPVAYQFRGFHAIHLSKAKAAFLLANTLNQPRLREIATRQLEYIVGYNPFAMSTIYGDGYDYPPLYGAYAGDVVGAVPVGIETFENDDEPYMPMQVNATYKEIWTHTTAAVMSVIASFMNE
ncbi:MAG: glycoside hydrolase family 9 protein [Chryseolinea sp.]